MPKFFSAQSNRRVRLKLGRATFDLGAMPVRQREGLAGLADVVPEFLDHAEFFRNGQFPKMFDFRMHSSTSQAGGASG